METESFDLTKALQIFKQEESYDAKGNLKEPNNTIAYMSKYFYPTVEGNHFVWEGNEFRVYDDARLKSVYINRLPKALSRWYFKEYTNLCRIINDVS